MGREAQLLSKSIGESFGNARVAEQKLSHVLEGQTSESVDDPENHELHEADETLAYWINKIYGDLAILAELLSLPLLARRIVSESPAKDNVTAMAVTPWDVGPQSTTLRQAHGFYASLATIAEGGAVTGLSVFETILKNTPAIIRAKDVEPSSEAEVRAAIYDGQAQHGVDIVARDGAIWPIGIQCKKKSSWPVTKVTARELDTEVEKAKAFLPKLRAFFLVSTAPDDEALQRHAHSITIRHKAEDRFPVSVLGWSELVRRATRHPLVASKHFGAFSSGPATPLLRTWRSENGKLQLQNEELAVEIRELIHDLADYPAGRIVFRHKESEDLVLQIRKLQAGTSESLERRRRVLELRDRLKVLQDREQDVVSGLRLLFAHKQLKEMVRIVWEKNAPLLVRSFVEQQIDPNLSVVTGLEKIRLRPPGTLDDGSVALFLTGKELNAIWNHHSDLRSRYPQLDTTALIELPDNEMFRRALPAVLRFVVAKLDDGVAMSEIEQRNWLDVVSWKVATA